MQKFIPAIVIGSILLAGSTVNADEIHPQLAFLASPSSTAEEQQEIITTLTTLMKQKVEAGEIISQEEIKSMISQIVRNGAEKTFKSYIADPIPANVQILAGDSIHWSGFSANLVFTADEKALKGMTREYVAIPMAGIANQAKTWFKDDITVIPGVKCYYRDDQYNKYYLFWDKGSERVFFKGIDG